MSKTSRILIAIMGIALCYMGAVRTYEWYQRKVKTYQPPQPSFLTQLQADEPYVSSQGWKEPSADIFLEEKPLSEVLQEQQAKETIDSILSDYRMHPAFRRFNQELQAATNGEVNGLEDLSNESLTQLMAKHPQIGQVVQKNMTQEDFAAVLKQIFSNPQYQKSIAVLQGKTAQTVDK